MTTELVCALCDSDKAAAHVRSVFRVGKKGICDDCLRQLIRLLRLMKNEVKS
jgi:RNA-binding protein YhbY